MVGAGTEARPARHHRQGRNDDRLASSRQLAKEGAIPGTARTYYVMARLFGSHDPIQAGEFEIPKGMGGAAILDLLQHGKPLQRLITVTEGMPSIIVEEKLAASPYLAGPTPPIAEGSVLPDSYGYQRGETRAAAGQADAGGDDARRSTELWPKRSSTARSRPRSRRSSSPRSSRRRPARRRERPMIAGVYCNRLRIGMKLDADPTVIYPVTKGKPLGRRILRSELNADNGYNTYERAGLPDGPDRQSGQGEHRRRCFTRRRRKALYFVADGTGGHVFAETLAEQNANVAKWYRDPPSARADVRNRGIGRGRMFMGGAAAVRGRDHLGRSRLMMSPHGAACRRRDRACPDDRRDLHSQAARSGR